MIKYIKSLLILLLITGCSIEDWSTFFNDPFAVKPDWDVYFNLPLLEKTENLKDYMKSPDIIKAESPEISYPGDQWPPLKGSPDLTTDVSSFPALIDFDNDLTTDFLVKGIKCEAGFLEIIVTLKKPSGEIFPLLVGDLNLKPIQIEDEDYEFDDGNIVDGSLVFKTVDFLTKTRPVEVDGNKIDFGTLTIIFNEGDNPKRIELNPVAPSDDLKLSFSYRTEFGSKWEITGDLERKVDLLSMKDVSLPIESIPLSIDPLIINMGLKNPAPFAFELEVTFTHADGTINLLNGDNPIISVLATNNKLLQLKPNGNIFDKENIKMNLSAKIVPASNVTISDSISFTVQLGLEGNGNINLNGFGGEK